MTGPAYQMTMYERIGDGPEGKRFLAQVRIAKGVYIPVWGGTADEAKARFERWLAEQHAAELKRAMRVERQQRARARKDFARVRERLSEEAL
ncbi:MAG: hypothetical protein ACR2OF_00045 [Hyphomicrobium sp.]